MVMFDNKQFNMTVREWVKDGELRGRITFSFNALLQAFPQASQQVILNDLQRLKRQGIIYSPYKSFYVVLPPQYALRRCVPPFYFANDLMRHLNKDYYFSTLTAAMLWGAAHQSPQQSFVTTTYPKLNTSATSKASIQWLYRNEIPQRLICEKKGETGTIRYSNAELTAVELVQYEHYLGGLSNVATILSELLESTDFAHASEGAFSVCKDSSVQRLGYIVEKILGKELQGEVIYHEWVRCCPAPHYQKLSLRSSEAIFKRDERWKIDVNTTIEADET